MYTQRGMWIMFGMTLTRQRRLDGNTNGNEVYNINNNVQDDGRKDNQDKGKPTMTTNTRPWIIIISTHSLFRCIYYCLCLMLVTAAAVAKRTKDTSPSHGLGSTAKLNVIGRPTCRLAAMYGLQSAPVRGLSLLRARKFSPSC